jgi:hypothetical protein
MNVNVENKMWMGLHCMSGYNGALLQSINNTDAPKFRRAATLRRVVAREPQAGAAGRHPCAQVDSACWRRPKPAMFELDGAVGRSSGEPLLEQGEFLDRCSGQDSPS